MPTYIADNTPFRLGMYHELQKNITNDIADDTHNLLIFDQPHNIYWLKPSDN